MKELVGAKPEPKPQKSQAKEELHPEQILQSLKEKQRLFATLKEEGLINKDKHLRMEKELAKTIHELEVLIPQLEVV